MTREQVSAAIVTALQTILVANGYNTNAGQRVYRFPVPIDQLNDGDYPCILAFDAFQPDSIRASDKEVDTVTLTMEVLALDRQEESWRNGTLPTKLNNLRADMKKALTVPAIFTSGGTGTMRRLGAEPMYDAETPIGLVSMKIELTFGEA